jgi:hypothetical protein
LFTANQIVKIGYVDLHHYRANYSLMDDLFISFSLDIVNVYGLEEWIMENMLTGCLFTLVWAAISVT